MEVVSKKITIELDAGDCQLLRNVLELARVKLGESCKRFCDPRYPPIGSLSSNQVQQAENFMIALMDEL